MNLTALPLLLPLALACLPACTADDASRTADSQGPVAASTSPAPGTVLPGDPDAMQRFLAGRRFTRVGGDDTYAFATDGCLEARLKGVDLRARWTATMDTLTLVHVEHRTGEAWVAGPVQTHALGWMDGKLNVAIDGVNYRDLEWSPVR